MGQVLDAPIRRSAVHFGENASFLLLRHSSTKTRLGLDISSVQMGENANRNMRAFELLSFTDRAGINYWDAAQLHTTGIHLKGAGMWQRFNEGQWVVATHVFIPKSDINRNLSTYIHDSVKKQCELLGCKQLDIVFLAADSTQTIQEIEPQLANAVEQGFVRSFGHIAFNIAEAKAWVTEPSVTLLHLQLEQVRLAELIHVLYQAECQRLGVVLVLTPALVECLYHSNSAEEQDANDSATGEPSAQSEEVIAAVKRLLEEYSCILKVVCPGADLEALKGVVGHI